MWETMKRRRNLCKTEAWWLEDTYRMETYKEEEEGEEGGKVKMKEEKNGSRKPKIFHTRFDRLEPGLIPKIVSIIRPGLRLIHTSTQYCKW
jgi:hypothetical protein